MKVIIAKEVEITTSGSVIEGWANGCWDIIKEKFDETDKPKDYFLEGYFSGYNEAIRRLDKKLNDI